MQAAALGWAWRSAPGPQDGALVAALEVGGELWPGGMPARLDASTVRRMAPDADRRIIDRVDMRSM